jgi:demethylmacrocin O-methyltransferase
MLLFFHSFDIIVDDGGHSMKQQITSLTQLLPKVRSRGVYVIEDLQTSYFEGADSGYLVNSTTIELIKRLVDDIQVDSPKKIYKNRWNNIFV